MHVISDCAQAAGQKVSLGSATEAQEEIVPLLKTDLSKTREVLSFVTRQTRCGIRPQIGIWLT
jgi:hypothetical protein